MLASNDNLGPKICYQFFGLEKWTGTDIKLLTGFKQFF